MPYVCDKCSMERGVHDPDCPNYYTGPSLVGVPGRASPPPRDADPGEPEGS